MATAATMAQDGTIRMNSASAFRVTFSASKLFVQVLSNGGTFWVKRYTSAAAIPAAAVTAGAIPGAAAESDFVEVSDGVTATFGSTDPTQAKAADGITSLVVAIDVWCEVAGDLIIVSQ